jgi:VCBS repeat-containing protein
MSIVQAKKFRAGKTRLSTMAIALAGVALFAARGEASSMEEPSNAEDFPTGTIFIENEDGSVTAKLPNGQIILIAEQDVILLETGEWQIANLEIYYAALLAKADGPANGAQLTPPSMQATEAKLGIDAVEKNFDTIQPEDEEDPDRNSNDPSNQGFTAQEFAKLFYNDSGRTPLELMAVFAGTAVGVETLAAMTEDEFVALISTPVSPTTNTPPVFTSDLSASVDENTTGTVYTATATDADNDTVTFAITGGTDAGAFSIDSATGALSFVDTPDFENPGDAGELPDNVYEVIIQASDGTNTTTQTVSITVNNVDEAPVFSSAATASVAENQSSAYTAVAADPENETVSYSLSGVDAERFNIDTSTGVVTFADRPDYENPNDDGNDNVYNFTITASDGANTSTQDVAVTVTDIEPEEPDTQIAFGKSGDVSQDASEESSYINLSDAGADRGNFAEHFGLADFTQLCDVFAEPAHLASTSGPDQFDLFAARAELAEQIEPLSSIDTVEGW